MSSTTTINPGPLLFLLCINDLTTVTTTSLSVSFADDTNIFFVRQKFTIYVYDI